MKFLYPTGGAAGNRYGTLTSPSHKSVPKSIKDGLPWACDNNAYTMGHKPERLISYLEELVPYISTCLFVSVPDSVGNITQTLDWFYKFAHEIKSLGFPTALVAQDLLESRSWPSEFDALFIGGSTSWKMGDGAKYCIRKAQSLGKHVHIGRVNSWKRYAHFRLMDGSDNFTCDGTKIIYEPRKVKNLWMAYESQLPLIKITDQEIQDS